MKTLKRKSDGLISLPPPHQFNGVNSEVIFWTTPWEERHADGSLSRSGGFNTYAVVANDKGTGVFNDGQVDLISVNGCGERRWDVSKWDAAHAREDYIHHRDTTNGELWEVIQHFSEHGLVIPEQERRQA